MKQIEFIWRTSTQASSISLWKWEKVRSRGRRQKGVWVWSRRRKEGKSKFWCIYLSLVPFIGRSNFSYWCHSHLLHVVFARSSIGRSCYCWVMLLQDVVLGQDRSSKWRSKSFSEDRSLPIKVEVVGSKKMLLLLLLLPGQVGSFAKEEEERRGVEESLCQGLESWNISGKLLKEEWLIGFSPREGFSLDVFLYLVSIDLCVIAFVICWWTKRKNI